MNKRMREIQAEIVKKTAAVDGFLAPGEGRDLDKAETTLNEIDQLQKEYDLEARREAQKKADVPQEFKPADKADGFKALAKVVAGKPLDENEKALISGTDAASGENYLVPDDVRAEINELRKTYVSAKNLVSVETTDALAGSVNYESGTPAGLTAFDDGDAITEETNPTFVKKTFTIGWRGKLIPVSRILLGAEKAGLMGYLNRWFVKNAVLTENSAIFAKLKSGYASGAPKAIAGWKALKKSITVDLDPSCLLDGVIITNQSGFACLDAEEDNDGRPVLQENPANRTEKLFQGLPIHVFPDAQLPNIDTTNFPLIYGSVKAGCTFVEYDGLEFTLDGSYLFNKNQNCLRVIEGFDVMSTDTGAYIYGKFSATPASTGS